MLIRQAEMIFGASDEAIPTPEDRANVRRRYEAAIAVTAQRQSRGERGSIAAADIADR